MPSPRDLEQLVSQLTVEEKASLTAGADFWTTVAIPRLDIPSVTVTDGPNGARGSALLGFGSVTAVSAPCGSALGSTWDVELVERVGAMLGEESRTKAARVLLAPTVNIMRSPLAGRNFECYSEDPLLTGKVAAAFIRGVQSQDVATTVKHFAGNEAEFERHTISSVIDERTLREIYLRPFELAVREGGSLGIMTAYNRLNGAYCTERPRPAAGDPARRVGLRRLRRDRLVRRRIDGGRGRGRVSTSRCRAPVASTGRPWPRPCWPTRSTRRCSTRR